MKIKDTIIDPEGRLLSFSVGNFFVSRRDVGNAFKSIPGIKVIKPASLYGDEFCECELNGKRLVASEDWGDSDRYWIGIHSREWNPDIEIVRSAFAKFRPFWGMLQGFSLLAFFAGTIFQILWDYLISSDP